MKKPTTITITVNTDLAYAVSGRKHKAITKAQQFLESLKR